MTLCKASSRWSICSLLRWLPWSWYLRDQLMGVLWSYSKKMADCIMEVKSQDREVGLSKSTQTRLNLNPNDVKECRAHSCLHPYSLSVTVSKWTSTLCIAWHMLNQIIMSAVPACDDCTWCGFHSTKKNSACRPHLLCFLQDDTCLRAVWLHGRTTAVARNSANVLKPFLCSMNVFSHQWEEQKRSLRLNPPSEYLPMREYYCSSNMC